MLSGWRSERTSYSRVHSNGGFEETIEAAKAAWTRIKKNTALTFEDWLCISMALVIGQAAAMAASQMNRPYGYHAAINEWLNANDLARHRRKACRGVAYFRRANRKPRSAAPARPFPDIGKIRKTRRRIHGLPKASDPRDDELLLLLSTLAVFEAREISTIL
jgi:hypothetical protein